MLTKKNAKASAVLAILFDMFGENEWKELGVEPYINGRENGFAIRKLDKAVAFSENRNSDSIVVYMGNAIDFSMQGNTPSEAVYRDSKMFCYDDYLGAATAIREYLTS